MTWKSENDTRKNTGDDKKPDWESRLEEQWNLYKEKFETSSNQTRFFRYSEKS